MGDEHGAPVSRMENAVNDIWTDSDGTRYKLVRPEIVSYPQKPVKINGKMVEQPNAEFTIVTAEKVE